MEQRTLNVNPREGRGKGPNRRLRQQGTIPAIVYGMGKNTAVSVNPRPIEALLLTEGGQNEIFTLAGADLNGSFALIRDYQIDPLSRRLLHVDLLQIDVKKKITVTVPVNLVGKAAGVAEGGVLNIIERSIEVRCLPTSIPKHIDVDVSALKIGDSIHVNQVTFPEGVENASHTNATLVAVVPPTKEEELAPSLAPTAEPEVITEKKPAEGEEAAAGKEGTAGGKEEKEKEKKK